jgi:DNA-binding GntR family transcriptional regulator
VSKSPLEPVARAATVRSTVYERLRAAIIQGALLDGQALASTELSAQLGVSRTPVREALVRLVQDGLALETDSGQVIVRPVSRAEIASFFELRAELERYAARQAVARGTAEWVVRLQESERTLAEAVDADAPAARQVELNDEFHALLYEGSGNALLRRALTDLEAATARRAIHALYERADPHTTVREHRRIVAAIEARDAEEAARQAGAHVERAGVELLALFESRRP